VSLVGVSHKEETLECGDCGTLHDLEELQKRVKLLKAEFVSAVMPPAAEMLLLHQQRVQRLEVLLQDIRRHLTPAHQLNLAVLQALGDAYRDIGDHAKQSVYTSAAIEVMRRHVASFDSQLIPLYLKAINADQKWPVALKQQPTWRSVLHKHLTTMFGDGDGFIGDLDC